MDSRKISEEKEMERGREDDESTMDNNDDDDGGYTNELPSNIHKKFNVILRSRTASSVQKKALVATNPSSKDKPTSIRSKRKCRRISDILLEGPRNTKPEIQNLQYARILATSFTIDSWKIDQKNSAYLVACFHYIEKMFVWELYDKKKKLNKKMEIEWDKVSAITATTPKYEESTLDIEFSDEVDPQQRKHTGTTYFTMGRQGSSHRRWHHIKFHPGSFEVHYNHLLSCDERLFNLSKKPFPSSKHPDVGSNSSSQEFSSDKSITDGDTGSIFSFPCTTELNWPFIHPQQPDLISEGFPPSDAYQSNIDPAINDQNYNSASSPSDVEDYLTDDNDKYSTPETDFSLDATINSPEEENRTSNNMVSAAQPEISGFDTSVSNPPLQSNETGQQQQRHYPSQISDENQHGLESNKATHQNPPSQFPDPHKQ